MSESSSRNEKEFSAFCHIRLTKIEAGWMKIALWFSLVFYVYKVQTHAAAVESTATVSALSYFAAYWQ